MILVVDMNWKRDSLGFYEFVSPITAVAEQLDKCTIKHYLEVSKQDLAECDRIILSGTALKDNEFLGKPERFRWLEEADKPVLGICAGMEILGLVYGARLVNCVEIGMTDITTVKANPLFHDAFRAYSLHSNCIEPNGQFEVWANSARCIQAIKHQTKPIVGVLFHPEVRNQEIIKKYIEEIGQAN